MKVTGLTVATDARDRIIPVFVDQEGSSKKTPEIWGKTFDGEQELHDLWNSGKIDNIYSILPTIKNQVPEERIDPYAGLTERERFKEVTGHTHIVDIRKDERRFRLGQTQPTSKGPRVIESNVLYLREKFNANMER